MLWSFGMSRDSLSHEDKAELRVQNTLDKDLFPEFPPLPPCQQDFHSGPYLKLSLLCDSFRPLGAGPWVQVLK